MNDMWNKFQEEQLEDADGYNYCIRCGAEMGVKNGTLSCLECGYDNSGSVPYECYEKYGNDLDGCSTQENEGCIRCTLYDSNKKKHNKQ